MHLNLSVGSMITILHDHLGVSKVSAKSVLRMLTPEQKFTQKVTSYEIMTLFHECSDNFLLRIVTQDETWVPHSDPETNKESKQWMHP